MNATIMMVRLSEVIDAHDWDSLAGLLHDEFICRYAHTGEIFDRDSWVRLNAEYPGFDHLVLHDCVGNASRAVGRMHVTGHVGGELVHFEVASFITLREDLIIEMTEVWADAEADAPEGMRPT